MSHLQRARVESTGDAAFGAIWSVRAPWAHPLWHSYVALLYDLTTPIAEGPAAGRPILYLPNATHEFLLYALKPDHPVPQFTDDPTTWHGFRRIEPANHGYQFVAAHDAAAFERIDRTMVAVDRARISPDTDFTRHWDSLFADGVSLKKGVGTYKESLTPAGATSAGCSNTKPGPSLR